METYLNRRQVAEFIGISYSNVGAFIEKYGLPYTKIGKRARFLKSDVQRYIQINRRNIIKQTDEATQ